MTPNTNTVTASNVRPSTHVDLPGAVDVDVAVVIPGEVVHCCAECGGPVEDDGTRDCGHDANVDSVLARAPVKMAGEVTLAPQQYDGALAAYGAQPDHWISGALLQSLRGLDDAAFRALCGEIEAAACEAAA